MKWKHWSILIILVLLNYIIFSTAFTKLAEQRRPAARPTRTPAATYEALDPTPLAWKILPTSTPLPTRTPFTPMPTEVVSPTAVITSTLPAPVTPSAEVQPTDTPLPATETPLPPTATATGAAVTHTVKNGETLSLIASQYGVTVQAIADANDLADPSRIIVGQKLRIPAPGQVPPTSTPRPAAAATATPKLPATKAPPATQKPPAASFQFTADVVWHPLVAPNCSGPAISKESIIQGANGNPVNGVRVEVDCYGNTWTSHASGTPGEYEAGHYDFAFGQNAPQDWTCTARVVDLNGQPVTSSEVVTIHFDTNNCKPDGGGHQVAIVNWTKHW